MKKSFLLVLSLITASTSQATYKDIIVQSRDKKAQYQDLDIALYPSGPHTIYNRNQLLHLFKVEVGFNVTSDSDVNQNDANQLIWRTNCELNQDGASFNSCLRDAQKQVALTALVLMRAGTKISSIVHVDSISKNQKFALKYKSLNNQNKNLMQIIANPDLNNRPALSVEEVQNNASPILEAK